jgi:hypothetical protein
MRASERGGAVRFGHVAGRNRRRAARDQIPTTVVVLLVIIMSSQELTALRLFAMYGYAVEHLSTHRLPDFSQYIP